MLKAIAAFGIVYVLLLLAAVFGWIMNIMAIIQMPVIELTGMTVARIIGIFLAPLGAILGWF